MVPASLFITFIFLVLSKGEDEFFNINTKTFLYQVSEKFLSITIDPAVLLAEVNLSDTSLTLAKHLSPAYIRLAGPSTRFVKYVDDEEEAHLHMKRGDTIYITPSMWFGINEWFSLANLTPVFGINDDNKSKGVWDPRRTLPLLEMSDKFGVMCYWQLGADCTNKSIIQYVDDLHILKQTLEGHFPEHTESWKVVGSDLSSCNFDDAANGRLENYIRDLDSTVNAVMWQSIPVAKHYMGFTNAEFWTSVPKANQPDTFTSTMRWARKVGEAAVLGYDVIFREPRVVEFTYDTPVYWFSFVHKKLMGTIVLEAKPIHQNSDLAVFAHCTKHKSNLIRNGAVTVMIINNGSELSSVNVRLGNIIKEKSMEIQSFFLTPSNEAAGKILLNGELLSMKLLEKADDILMRPNLRRVKLWPHLTLETPASTIAFFILTGAKCAICIKNEKDLSAVLEEIRQDQSEEQHFSMESRMLSAKSPLEKKNTLHTMKKNILKEVELDKAFYDTIVKNPKPYHLEKDDDQPQWEKLHKHLKGFIEKSKNKKSHTSERFEGGQKEKSEHPNLQLTIQEIEGILKNRARAKALAKHIKLSSAELDMLVDKATLKIPKYFVSKRDINHVLLEEKANFYQNNMFSQETYEKMAKANKKGVGTKLKLLSRMRTKRSINTPLLNLKAMLEETEKYLMEHKKNHPDTNCRMKRDINLDLLKQRSQSESGLRKKEEHPQYFDLWSKKEKKMSEDRSSEELFDEQFETKAFEELLESDEFSTGSRTHYIDQQSFKTYPQKHNSKIITNPLIDQLFKQLKPNLPNKSQQRVVSPFLNDDDDDEDELQLLRSSEEKLYRKMISGGKPLGDIWKLKSSSKGEKKKKQWLCADLGDYNFSDELEDSYLRKKRNLNDEVNLKTLKSDVKNEIKKLRLKFKGEKAKYLKSKKFGKHKTHIQQVPQFTTKDQSKVMIIKNEDSKENIIPSSLELDGYKRSNTRKRRPETFGQDKPRSELVKEWKAEDIQDAGRDNMSLRYPRYSWMMDDEYLKNGVLKGNIVRQRRYIGKPLIIPDGNSLDEEEKEGRRRNIKLNNRDKIEWNKNNEIFANKFHPLTDYYRNVSIKTSKFSGSNGSEISKHDEVITTTTEKVLIKEKQNLSRHDELHSAPYLQKALGKEKAQSIKTFFDTLKNQFNNVGSTIKTFFKKLF